jgi:flagellar L-ring protein precursor FlgH
MFIKASQLALAAAILISAGCATTLQPREPRNRDYQSPCEATQHTEARNDGSLFTQGAERLFVDQRAYRMCDIVTIRIRERSSAAGSAGTNLKKQSEFDTRIEAFLGLMSKIEDISNRIDGDKLLDTATQYAFKGEGSTKRKGALDATVTVYVRRILPNGHLFVEGSKTILVNQEEHYFYISGVVRQVDIDGSNSISSDLISDAQVEFTGQGIISDVNQPGVLSRWLGWMWPF